MANPVNERDAIAQTITATQTAKAKAANTITAYTAQLETVKGMLNDLNGSPEMREKNKENIQKLEKLKADLTRLIDAMKQQHAQASAVHSRLNALSK